MGKALFVTGTGTDIGKTYVTGLIVKKLRDAGYSGGSYKAALSGAEEDEHGNLLPGDALFVNDTANLNESADNLVSYVYKEAVSPHLAARLNNRPIELSKIKKDFARAKDKYEYLTMEGSGGIICPIRWDEEEHLLLADIVKELRLPALIVADAGLGTINAVVLTADYLARQQIPAKGVIFNNCHKGNVMEEDNARMVEELTGLKIVAFVRPGDKELDIPARTLADLYEE